MINNKPALTIIMPTFNRAKVVLRAVESLFKQSFSDWELIIVDDGSNDGTIKRIEEIREKDSRIKCIYGAHKGVAAARNLAIKEAVGDYITFLDSDDEYKKNHLLWHYRYLLAHPGIDMIWGGVKVIGSPMLPDANDTSKLVNANECTLTGTFFIKHEVLQLVGGFPQVDYAEDHALYELLLKQGYKVKRVEMPSYIYHHEQDDSITVKMLKDKFLDLEKDLDEQRFQTK